MYFAPVEASAEDLAVHVPPSLRPAIETLARGLASVEWNKTAISAAIKQTLSAHGLKMPVLAHAVRVLVCGRPQTPSLDAVLELFTRSEVLARLQSD